MTEAVSFKKEQKTPCINIHVYKKVKEGTLLSVVL